MKKAGVRRISSAQDILGAPATYMVAYSTERFRRDNPKPYQAFVDALKEAQDLVKKNPAEAAKIYLDHAKDNVSVEEVVAILKDPGSSFDMAPSNVLTFAKFMAKQGIIKVAPATWQDMFFPEVQGLSGS
jgi:NitT/TauT family transport system substrate-binding protein